MTAVPEVTRKSVGLRSERGPLLAALMLATALVALDSTIIATAVPFSSMARSSAAWPTGSSPSCQATPNISVFNVCPSPNRRSANAAARR